MTSIHPAGHIDLTIRSASFLDQPIRTELLNENARRSREGGPKINVAREGVQSLINVGPKRTVLLSRVGVHSIGDFCRLDPSQVPSVLSAMHGALRALYKE
jgi:hypothetical protein